MPVEFSSHVRDFVDRLLDKDPNKRLGGGTDDALEVKGHSFFNVSSFLTSVTLQ
jgi:serine/threonine protein kinase